MDANGPCPTLSLKDLDDLFPQPFRPLCLPTLSDGLSLRAALTERGVTVSTAVVLLLLRMFSFTAYCFSRAPALRRGMGLPNPSHPWRISAVLCCDAFSNYLLEEQELQPFLSVKLHSSQMLNSLSTIYLPVKPAVLLGLCMCWV